MTLDDLEVRERVGRVEALLETVEALPDAGGRAAAVETLQALLELDGEGRARMLAVAERVGGEELLAAFAGDELVAHLLLLHDLHPVPAGARVQAALDDLRPYLEAHGGKVEFLGIEAGVAQLRLAG